MGVMGKEILLTYLHKRMNKAQKKFQKKRQKMKFCLITRQKQTKIHGFRQRVRVLESRANDPIESYYINTNNNLFFLFYTNKFIFPR
jgi:hypothetical protein